MIPNDPLRDWKESAKYWAEYRNTIRAMFAPVTSTLLEQAGIARGQCVLDVAGGPGEPSLTIAELVGPEGHVTCTDALAEMVDAARAEAQSRGLTNVAFRQCLAEALPFDSYSFDAVVCRLGVMFFPDPLTALREMLRVAKPGAPLALAVWDKSEVNPFSYVITRIISRHLETPPADADAPGAFRFAESGKLAGLLKQAGARDVTEEVLKFHIAAPISPAEFWTMRSKTSETLQAKLAKVTEEKKAEIATEVLQGLQEFFPHNQMEFPAQMIIVTGRKPD